MGYSRAGFEVVGVDLLAQPHYPFAFVRGDALEFLENGGAEGFDAIHASPPCQAYSSITNNMWHRGQDHPDLLGPTREALDRVGLPYVIENVPGSPIRATMMLCGTMFGLAIRKHRYFEANWALPLFAPAPCGDHRTVYDPWHGGRGVRSAAQHRVALDIPWMPEAGGASRDRQHSGDLYNAIPPAYTEWIGRHLMAQLAP